MRVFSSLAVAVLLALAAQPAAAGGGMHARTILTLMPVAPLAGDTVRVTVRYLSGSAPERDTVSVNPPEGHVLAVEVRRVAADMLAGTFFADRAGDWRATSWQGAPVTFTVSGDAGVVLRVPARPAAEGVPYGVLAAFGASPYVVALALWLLARRALRTPRPSYA